jgi:hypothetical protein
VIVAHVGGVPVEEILPSAASVGVGLLLVRGWLGLQLRRRRAGEPPDDTDAQGA